MEAKQLCVNHCLVFTIAFGLLAGTALAQPGTVVSEQKISALEGNFTGTLEFGDLFGSLAGIGDLDGDGVGDLAVGAPGDDDGGSGRGAVWILFLNVDGTVDAHQKISSTEGNFTGPLGDQDQFGEALAWLGDLDGDGVGDLAVGAPGADDGGSARGAVWVLFLNSNGTVKASQKISDTTGGFAGTLLDQDQFGSAVSHLPDVDGDGSDDLAVGSKFDDDGGANRGAVWILFLNSDGTVNGQQKISQTQGGFMGSLADQDLFGTSLATLGDLDQDCVPDLAIGASGDDDGGSGRGAVWILFLNSDGTVKGDQKISDTGGGFSGVLEDFDRFGRSLAVLGVNGDGIPDLVVGADADDDGGPNRGAVWILFLNSDGTVGSHQKISDTDGNFTGLLSNDDNFGLAVGALGDIDGDNLLDLAVGAPFDDDGSFNVGAVWILFLDGLPDPDGLLGCPPDLDGSGMVDASDLAQVLGSWGPNPGSPADFNGDCEVNATDLAQLLGSWGPCP